MKPEPAAAYRLQLHPGFGFDEAAGIVDYLADLGAGYLYASPYLQAAAGSTHGYDVVDPSRVNEELGGGEAHARLCDALLDAGLGQMIDVVPNHMAITGRQNPWWWDVLENGPSSRYANYFDVDWEASEERWPNKVLLPVLGDHYGRALEAGQLKLSHESGAFTLHYYEHVFPIDPSSLPEPLGHAAEACGSEELAFLAESHARLPRPTVTARQAVERRHRDKTVLARLRARLFSEAPETASAVDAVVARLNRDPDALDALIERQNYRPAFWRTGNADLGYRRFFDIKDLAGLRVEDPEVFHATHALPVDWVRKGRVHGLRIDHPDGLRDPAGYFQRLRENCPDAWIVAEKILGPGETLPPEWPIAGTNGYDFLNRTTGLFVDPGGEEALTRGYEEFTGEQTEFPALVRQCKRLVLAELLGAEVSRLASLFVTVCERHRRHRDYTRQDLREALLETAACFPVYRAYVSTSGNTVSRQDEHYIRRAINAAMTQRDDLDPELFHFLQNLLLLRVAGGPENELAVRFQQLTAPAMAKGFEDTALYRYHRLIALNEVGGEPDRFGVSPEAFHEACARAQAEHPSALLASTTHDTKRSEDVRARLALLSEIPEDWGEAVRRWSLHNARHRDAGAPDPNTEYLFYQTLVGAWPISLERISAYMEKAAREAKVHTTWTAQNEAWERGLHRFVQGAMTDDTFRADLENFVAGLVTPGRINSLAQTLIKLTAPGVPDLYQGTELWDLSLVDPDNRRPVDFALRRRLLAELAERSPEDILSRMGDGLPKLWVTRQALHFRRENPALFGPEADYRPLIAEGAEADHVLAFIRAEAVTTVVPRLVMKLGPGRKPDRQWTDTTLELPAGNWRNILTGEDTAGGPARLRDVLARFPVALLVRKEE